MRLALLGYGKMGHIIEKIAIDRGHQVVLKISGSNAHELSTGHLKEADAAIEFSTPSTALNNIYQCFDAGVPVVAGTTGWYSNLADVKEKCEATGQSIIYGTNFSIGVNVFFYANKVLAKLMAGYPYYDIQVEEIHHTQKLDAPSGTAITIAEGIMANNQAKKEWVNVLVTNGQEPPIRHIEPENLLIESLRIDNVPGTHTVVYDSEVDMITFKHVAHNRNGFALGAILAAEWIINNRGFHPVQDMFNFEGVSY